MIWHINSILKVQTLFIEAISKLKQGKFYEGWCILEKCEVLLLGLEKNFDIYSSKDEYKLQFIKKKVAQLQELFPYKYFMSPEFRIKKQICSICHKNISLRNSCGHQLGEIYNGELCCRVIKEAKLLGVALVRSPRNKYAVPFATDKNTGKQIDQYDYSLVEYLVKALPSPFAEWSCNWTKKRHPHSKFLNFGKNDKCPCESGKIYDKCCLNKQGVLKDHVQFEFLFDPPDDLPRVMYNY